MELERPVRHHFHSSTRNELQPTERDRRAVIDGYVRRRHHHHGRGEPPSRNAQGRRTTGPCLPHRLGRRAQGDQGADRCQPILADRLHGLCTRTRPRDRLTEHYGDMPSSPGCAFWTSIMTCSPGPAGPQAHDDSDGSGRFYDYPWGPWGDLADECHRLLGRGELGGHQ